jgi:cystathionine gamma-lyase
MEFETLAIHAGETPNCKEGGSGDVVMPVHLSSTFARLDVRNPTGGYEYSRTGNPTRDALESRLAALEGARYGLAFASGLAAQTTICLGLLKAGDHVVAFDDLYGGSRRLFEKVFSAGFNIDVSYVDARRAGAVAEAIRINTALIWMETPTNPMLRLCDIGAIAGISREKGIPLVIDNTFMSPYFQKPLTLGADISMHSTTKYICGHSDSVGGAIMVNRRDLYERLKFIQNAAGTMQSPFNSYLLLRSTKTLAVRMRRHQDNALKVAQFLSTHPRVSKVIYPGLESHPQHELARMQMSGFGGMLSFEIAGNLSDAEAFLRNVKIFALAESLGGVESLIEHPALMTHASVPAEVRRDIGVSDTLIRISVGIEEACDLIEDLNRAFENLS